MSTDVIPFQALRAKWKPILEANGIAPIGDRQRTNTVARLLENMQTELNLNVGHLLTEDTAPTNVTANVQNWDPVLVAMVRRAMPKLIAYDVAGVQPMSGPTGLIFSMKSRYGNASGAEALYNTEPNTAFSGTGTHAAPSAGDPGLMATGDIGTGMATSVAEALGATGTFNEMSFTIDKASVEAKSRALKAEWSIELEQDLKKMHGLDAKTELGNMLSTEILREINREIVRLMYVAAKPGAQTGVSTAGVFDLDNDTSGRWSVEKWKGLMFQIERDANAIARDTRRGKGNFIICSGDVASALAMAGKLDYSSALDRNMTNDEAEDTYVGILNGRYKVYVDPFFSGGNVNFYCIGYKGTSAWDAGIYYCPYVPMEMMEAKDPDTFQPKLAFKTRYGMTANPFYSLNANSNGYYRIVRVDNIGA
jgi:hypothetical protein